MFPLDSVCFEKMAEASDVECYQSEEFITLENVNIQDEIVLTELRVVQFEEMSPEDKDQIIQDGINPSDDDNEEIQYVFLIDDDLELSEEIQLQSPDDDHLSENNSNQCEDDSGEKTENNSHEDMDEVGKEEFTVPCLLCVNSEDGIGKSLVKTDLNSNNVTDNDSVKGLGRKIKKYKCEKCKRIFKKRNHLAIHLKKHNRDRPFRCDVCDLSFLFKVHLNVHSWKHFGVKSD